MLVLSARGVALAVGVVVSLGAWTADAEAARSSSRHQGGHGPSRSVAAVSGQRGGHGPARGAAIPAAQLTRSGGKHHGGHGAVRGVAARAYSFGSAKQSGRGGVRHASFRKGGKSMFYAYAAPEPAATSALPAEPSPSYAYDERGMSCVPFARMNSGIEVAGNAGTWWNNAAGTYERGFRPEAGSVLNFRSTGRMRMGHVAVVTNVLSQRSIEIDHANWSGRGRISRGVVVADVSPGNDWTAVRVSLGRGAQFGSVYPTYGFIYDRPDHGVLVANTGAVPTLVRQVAQRSPVAEPVEVAELPDDLPAPRAARTVSRRRVVATHRHVRHRRYY